MSKKWTIITGASKGLGLEFAKELAKQRKNLILIARTESKLLKIQQELTQKYQIEIEIFSLDLSDLDKIENLYDKIKNKNLKIEMLINNAGFGSFGSFKNLDLNTEINMINLNIIALVKLIQLFLPDLKETKGSILNIASIAGFMPIPYMATYSSSKAFVLNFSKALRQELAKDGVNVSVLCPGPTKTDFFKIAKFTTNNFFESQMMRADKVVKTALKKAIENQAVIVPGLKNKIMVFFTKILPQKIVVKIAARFFRH